MTLEVHRCTPDEWAELALVHPQWASMYAHVFAEGAECWSGTQDGVLLGAAGLLYHAPQQAYAWGAFLTERWPKVPRTLVKLLRARLLDAVERRGLVRIEAKADCAHIAGCRFLEALGLRCEGLTACSNQYGEDQFLYAYVPATAWQQRQARLAERYGPLAPEVEQARIAHVTAALTEGPRWCR